MSDTIPNHLHRAVAHAAVLEIERLVRAYVDDVEEIVARFADVAAAELVARGELGYLKALGYYEYANEPHDTIRPPEFTEEAGTFEPTVSTLADEDEPPLAGVW